MLDDTTQHHAPNISPRVELVRISRSRASGPHTLTHIQLIDFWKRIQKCQGNCSLFAKSSQISLYVCDTNLILNNINPNFLLNFFYTFIRFAWLENCLVFLTSNTIIQSNKLESRMKWFSSSQCILVGWFTWTPNYLTTTEILKWNLIFRLKKIYIQVYSYEFPNIP